MSENFKIIARKAGNHRCDCLSHAEVYFLVSYCFHYLSIFAPAIESNEIDIR